MATLLAHGIAQGGYIGAPDGHVTTVTLNTTGASFLIAMYAADATHGSLDPITDTAGNTWTAVPDYPGPGDGHNGLTFSAAIYWVANPITSATHTVTMTSGGAGAGGVGHACLAVQAWSGMGAPTFGTQTWAATSTGSLTLGPFTSVGYTLGFAAIGFGDATAAATATLSTPGWTVLDTLAMVPGVYGAAGMTAGYQLLPAATAVTAAWTFPSVGASLGAGIFSFTFTAPPPPTTTTYVTRRLRRFALPWDEAHKQKTISRLELIGQVGIGDTVTTNPVVMLRLSRDGGMTWGVEHQLTVGAMGQYLARVYLTRLGRARNPVVEITTTDPVAWSWVECLVDLTEGTS